MLRLLPLVLFSAFFLIEAASKIVVKSGAPDPYATTAEENEKLKAGLQALKDIIKEEKQLMRLQEFKDWKEARVGGIRGEIVPP